MERYLLVAAGGMLGALARYGLSGWISRSTSGSFPFGTLAVNMLGCLVIGFFMTLAETRFGWSPNIRLFAAVGFLGAFTTFSTFSFETMGLLQEGSVLLGTANMVASLFGCVLAAAVGISLAKLV